MLDQVGEFVNLGGMFIKMGKFIPQNKLQTTHY